MRSENFGQNPPSKRADRQYKPFWESYRRTFSEPAIVSQTMLYCEEEVKDEIDFELCYSLLRSPNTL